MSDKTLTEQSSEAALNDMLLADDVIEEAEAEAAAPPAPEEEVLEVAAAEPADAESSEHQTFIRQEKTDKPYWYVVYTYSGYEKKVMNDLLKTIQNHHLQDTILDVKVPEEDTIETRNGKRRHVARKLYPGYVMVKMYLTDDSWYVVRNTRGVTGFVGPGSKPIPLSDTEVRAMGIENVRIRLDVAVGDNVMVTSGPFENFVGEVLKVDTEKQSVQVVVSMFGRDVTMDLDFVMVKKI